MNALLFALLAVIVVCLVLVILILNIVFNSVNDALDRIGKIYGEVFEVKAEQTDIKGLLVELSLKLDKDNSILECTWPEHSAAPETDHCVPQTPWDVTRSTGTRKRDEKGRFVKD